jgi:L,D-peptidoglycan transpeptidase YkuD (ErfK/YbiS/YcfS/YnhG family)
LRTLPSGTSQVVIVHADGFHTSYGTVETFHRRGGHWTQAFAPMPARIGSNGFSDSKREGDRTTPTGVYAFDATMYGIAANPGVRYRYHRLVPDDYWNENSESPGYNTFAHGSDPGGASEALWQISPQYTHFAVIRYNMPAVPGRGSGIFLHQTNGNATLGCVSLSHADLVAVLTWLDPAAAPRIVLAPLSALGRY